MKKKTKGTLTLAQQLSLIACVCVLIPSLILSYSSIYSMQKTTIQERQQQASAQCDQLSAHAEQTAELFHMSTQVFLNTPKLIDHLTQLKSGETMDALTLLNFFREDIASLEKIVLSNPNLYQIRVYSVAEDISEMVPILYSARRLADAPWYSEDFQNGTWYFDYADTLLPPTVP